FFSGALLRPVGFSDFVNAVGPRVFDDRSTAAAPGNLNRQIVSARREDARGFIARQVTATADDFLSLRNWPTEHFNFRADAPGVWSLALQTHGDTRSRGVIVINCGRGIQVVHDDIEIAIVVEVSQSHAVGNAAKVDSPLGAGFLEGEIVAIVEGEVGGRESWKFLH